MSIQNEIYQLTEPLILSCYSFDVSLITNESDPENDGVDDVMVGHDSYEFNGTMSKFPYRSIKTIFTNESERNIDNLETSDSEHSDYSSQFKLNETGFLTSTLLDEVGVLKDIKSDDNVITAIVSKIEMMVSTFVQQLQPLISELKGISTNKKKEQSKGIIFKRKVLRLF